LRKLFNFIKFSFLKNEPVIDQFKGGALSEKVKCGISKIFLEKDCLILKEY
jgi:hypothetical protein